VGLRAALEKKFLSYRESKPGRPAPITVTKLSYPGFDVGNSQIYMNV